MSREELEQQEWAEKGQKMAAEFLAGRIGSLQAALSEVPGHMMGSVIASVSDTLLRNIVLPREQDQWQEIEKALQGIIEIKGSAAMQVIPGIKDLLKQYEQTMQQYLEQFRAQMEQAMQAAGQGGGGSLGMGGSPGADAGTIAAMQKEWERISAEINQQFEQQLDQFKAYLAQV
jgi:hypothetical protein